MSLSPSAIFTVGDLLRWAEVRDLATAATAPGFDAHSIGVEMTINSPFPTADQQLPNGFRFPSSALIDFQRAVFFAVIGRYTGPDPALFPEFDQLQAKAWQEGGDLDPNRVRRWAGELCARRKVKLADVLSLPAAELLDAPAPDVSLAGGTLAAAKGMAAHLRELARTNTTAHEYATWAASVPPPVGGSAADQARQRVAEMDREREAYEDAVKLVGGSIGRAAGVFRGSPGDRDAKPADGDSQPSPEEGEKRRREKPSAVTGQVERDDQPVSPEWITRHFRSKQYALLKALWGKQSVSESELIAVLGYGASSDPSDTLRRRVSETNKSLVERSEAIGESWTIRERTREGTKSFFLDRQK